MFTYHEHREEGVSTDVFLMKDVQDLKANCLVRSVMSIKSIPENPKDATQLIKHRREVNAQINAFARSS